MLIVELSNGVHPIHAKLHLLLHTTSKNFIRGFFILSSVQVSLLILHTLTRTFAGKPVSFSSFQQFLHCVGFSLFKNCCLTCSMIGPSYISLSVLSLRFPIGTLVLQQVITSSPYMITCSNGAGQKLLPYCSVNFVKSGFKLEGDCFCISIFIRVVNERESFRHRKNRVRIKQ